MTHQTLSPETPGRLTTLRHLAAFATECLLIVLNEEWWHRMFAERDLARLAERV
jgi:hypothetical protein